MVSPHTLVGIALLLAAGCCVASEAEASVLQWPRACDALLRERLPDWQATVPPPDAAAWARGEGIDPIVAVGDFDADGRRDWATIGHHHSSQHVVLCLSTRPKRTLHVVAHDGCGDLIARMRRGTRLHNYDANRDERLRRDGIAAYCHGKAGSMIVLERRGVRVFIHSD